MLVTDARVLIEKIDFANNSLTSSIEIYWNSVSHSFKNNLFKGLIDIEEFDIYSPLHLFEAHASALH